MSTRNTVPGTNVVSMHARGNQPLTWHQEVAGVYVALMRLITRIPNDSLRNDRLWQLETALELIHDSLDMAQARNVPVPIGYNGYNRGMHETR